MTKSELTVSPRLWNGYIDIVDGFKDWRLWWFLGYQDIKQRYARSMLGPLWMVLGLGITIIGVGFLYGQIFKSNSGNFLPFLAISLAVWSFVSAAISDGMTIFQAQAALLKSISVPYTTIILRNIVKNAIVFLHYLVAVVITFAATGYTVDYHLIFAVPGFVLICANLYWITLLIGMVCARFRDVAQIGLYALQMIMFMTPIVWQPNQVRPGSPFIIYNPMYHLIEVFRAPIFEHRIPVESFAVSIAMFIVGTAVTLLAFNKFKRYINFWI